ncbi:MAG TPA: hypothetical protein VFW90_00930 [Candidatus Saccharimonadales bacterium]|nr:hypothetical protein [Candidatus Saccharimonadales bacterium]
MSALEERPTGRGLTEGGADGPEVSVETPGVHELAQQAALFGIAEMVKRPGIDEAVYAERVADILNSAPSGRTVTAGELLGRVNPPKKRPK